jgi:hypothetical protein
MEVAPTSPLKMRPLTHVRANDSAGLCCKACSHSFQRTYRDFGAGLSQALLRRCRYSPGKFQLALQTSHLPAAKHEHLGTWADSSIFHSEDCGLSNGPGNALFWEAAANTPPDPDEHLGSSVVRDPPAVAWSPV